GRTRILSLRAGGRRVALLSSRLDAVARRAPGNSLRPVPGRDRLHRPWTPGHPSRSEAKRNLSMRAYLLAIAGGVPRAARPPPGGQPPPGGNPAARLEGGPHRGQLRERGRLPQLRLLRLVP